MDSRSTNLLTDNPAPADSTAPVDNDASLFLDILPVTLAESDRRRSLVDLLEGGSLTLEAFVADHAKSRDVVGPRM